MHARLIGNAAEIVHKYDALYRAQQDNALLPPLPPADEEVEAQRDTGGHP